MSNQNEAKQKEQVFCEIAAYLRDQEAEKLDIEEYGFSRQDPIGVLRVMMDLDPSGEQDVLEYNRDDLQTKIEEMISEVLGPFCDVRIEKEDGREAWRMYFPDIEASDENDDESSGSVTGAELRFFVYYRYDEYEEDEYSREDETVPYNEFYHPSDAIGYEERMRETGYGMIDMDPYDIDMGKY